jgi:hypothetical protein
MTTETGRAGATTEVLEKGEQAVAKAQQQVQQQAAHAGGRLKEQIDRRSTELGTQGRSLARALHRAGEQLHGEGDQAPARLAHAAADQIERASGYLTGTSADRLLDDVEAQARRRPWLAAGAGALLGFAASRLLKASSGRRYEQQRLGQGRSWSRRELEPAGPTVVRDGRS